MSNLAGRAKLDEAKSDKPMRDKVAVMIFILFTMPLLGYFIVNGYAWLFGGNELVVDKMAFSLSFGLISLSITSLSDDAEDTDGELER